MEKKVQKDVGVVRSRTGSESQRALLKTPTHGLVEGKGRRFSLVWTEDPGGNAFFDDAGDKVDVAKGGVEHLRSFRGAGGSGQEVPLEQQRLEEVPIGITQFETGFDKAAELFQ